MTLQELPLVGTLPAAWGGNDSFPALIDLEIGASYQGNALAVDLFGRLPAEWGHSSAFQQLELLDLMGCNLSGEQTTCSYSFKQTSACAAFGKTFQAFVLHVDAIICSRRTKYAPTHMLKWCYRSIVA